MMSKEEEKNLYTLLFFTAVVVVVVLLTKKAAQKIRQNIAEANPQRDTSQLAVRFYQALEGWGTDENAIFQLAAESRGLFNEVARNYKNRYQRALDTDLAEDLSAPDLQKFYQILNQKS